MNTEPDLISVGSKSQASIWFWNVEDFLLERTVDSQLGLSKEATSFGAFEQGADTAAFFKHILPRLQPSRSFRKSFPNRMQTSRTVWFLIGLQLLY